MVLMRNDTGEQVSHSHPSHPILFLHVSSSKLKERASNSYREIFIWCTDKNLCELRGGNLQCPTLSVSKHAGPNSAHASLNTGLVLHILLLYDPLALVLCRTLVTRITFLWSFPKPGLHTCFGLNLTRGLNKSHVFASRPSFTESAVLHKNHVLAGPVQALFAARMALSMVAKTAEGG